MKRLILVLALILSACASAPPTIKTTAGKRAYTANEVALRVVEFQRVVIDSSDKQLIPVPVAREIVQWCQTVFTALEAAPQGWQAMVKSSWQQVKPKVESLGPLSHWTFVFDTMLEVM